MTTKELAQDDPKFLPTQMGLTEHKLRQLRKEYAVNDLPAVVQKGDDAYHQVHNKVMAITKIRTGIEKVRKELKADALAWGKKVDGEASRLKGVIEELEGPWRIVKETADAAEARRVEEKRRAEEKRMQDIENRVRDIKAQAEGLLNADSLTIANRIVVLGNILVTEENFGEYLTNAKDIFATVLANLEQAQAAALRSEAQAAEIAKQVEENARIAAVNAQLVEDTRLLREEMEEQKRVAAQAEADRLEQVRIDAEAIAEEQAFADSMDNEPEVTAVAEPVAAAAVSDESVTKSDESDESDKETKNPYLSTPFEAWWQRAGSQIRQGANEAAQEYGFRLSQQAWLAAVLSDE
jgi:hypothetical protein